MSEESPDLGFDEAGVAEGESDIPWKPPVIAAILGALVVGIYVIYAIVTGPSVEGDAADDPAPPTVVAPGPTDGLPPGYVAVADDVGARAESVMETPTVTIVAVSTAVRGGVDPSDVDLLGVAYWELRTPSGSIPMQNQYRLPGPTGTGGGSFSVTFPPNSMTTGSDIVVYPAATAVAADEELELPANLPQIVTDVRIDLGEGVIVVVESLTIDESGGYVEWTVADGLTARLDVVVRFLGTGESGAGDTVLVPAYLGPSLLGPEFPEMSSVPYRFGSQYQLARSGAPLDTARPPTAIVVEFTVEAVTAVTDPVVLPVGG